MRQKMSAAIGLLNFFHWTRQIDIDHVVAHLHQNQRGFGHLVGVRTHQLPRDWVVIQTGDLVVIHFAKSTFTCN